MSGLLNVCCFGRDDVGVFLGSLFKAAFCYDQAIGKRYFYFPIFFSFLPENPCSRQV